MTLAKLSYYAFDVGTIALAISFILFVVYTTMLAMGRRQVLAVAGAGAGAGTGGGTFTTGRAVAGREISAGGIAQAFVWVSFVLIAIGLVVRAYLVGRGPWGNLYEFSVAFAFGIVGSYLYLGRRYPLRAIAFLPIGVAFFLLAYAFTIPQAISPLVPALDNPPLLTIHVSMAVLSYGIFAVSFGAAIGYLVQGRENRVSWLPPAKVLDEVAYRAVIIGFPIFATLIVLGSWWAAIAWGRYWGWDPKETSALVTWLIYAVYLHARSQRGWAGRPAALILVIGFAAVLFTYLGGNLFFGGLHSYAGT
jgi:cytochrome c-type biogenesis protein CcsB